MLEASLRLTPSRLRAYPAIYLLVMVVAAIVHAVLDRVPPGRLAPSFAGGSPAGWLLGSNGNGVRRDSNALALSAIVLLWARSSWEPKSQSRDRRMAAMLVLATLASPHLFGYDLMLFLSPFFVVWRLYPQGHVRTPVRRRPAPRHDCAPLGVLARRPRAQPQRSKPFSTWAFHKTAALQVGVPLALFWAWLVVRPTLDEASECRTRAPTP